MSFGTKWAIRAAVFGLVLHLLLTSALICIIILVAKHKMGLVKSIATIAPFSVHALEFLAAVSLLRTKRMNNPFIEKCSAWLTSAKYLSPCIIIEEGILISWEFHLGIVAIVGLSYALAMGLVTNCLRMKCAATAIASAVRTRRTDERRRVISDQPPAAVSPVRFTLVAAVRVHAPQPYPERVLSRFETESHWHFDDEDEDLIHEETDNEEAYSLPSYDDALRLLLSQFEAEEHLTPHEIYDDPPPCYDDVLNSPNSYDKI